MTIKTLEFIHNLLKDEADKTEALYKMAKDTFYECAESENPNKKQLKSAEEHLTVWRNAYNKAAEALSDFENQEW